jgi:hypothetical protein
VRPASGHYASAINLARLTTLGLHHAPHTGAPSSTSMPTGSAASVDELQAF